MSFQITELLELLTRLRKSGIAFTLAQNRDDAISILVAVPGERWEIDLVDYNGTCQVEVEVFRSDGTMHSVERVDELFSRFSD